MKLLRLEKRVFPRLRLVCFAALFFMAVSCTQDPIFSMISREVKPREPLIKGVPSKMVVFKSSSSSAAALPISLYVGATSLHRYAGAAGSTTGAWDTNIPQPPGGMILDLAATKNYLYALINADSPALYRWNGDPGTPWENIPFSDPDFPRLQVIYGQIDDEGKAVTDYLFVGARSAGLNRDDTKDYAVFYIDDNGSSLSIQRVKTETALLTGVLYDGGHYFSTNGDGIYLWNGGSSDPVQITGEENVKGMIQISDPALVLAFTYAGEILKVSGAGTLRLNSNWSGQYLWGPAAVWRDSAGNPALLMITVITPDSTYGPTYGYREINLRSGPVATSVPGEMGLREPGNGTTAFPSTMDDLNRYRDSIASKPVNSIFQVPQDIDSDMPIFASIQGTGTMKNNTDGGLWSYRIRDGVWQWNAE
jgi:hypothetical protein